MVNILETHVVYSPTGRRNHGRPLKRLLDTWDRNGSTSGPTPWQIYDDDDDVVFGCTKPVSSQSVILKFDLIFAYYYYCCSFCWKTI